MNNLVNSDYSLNPHDYFTFLDGGNKGKKLKVISTYSDGKKVEECIDVVKNLENNNIIKIKRLKLQSLNPVFIYVPVDYKKKSKKKR